MVEVGGVPEIVGGELGGAATVMAKGARDDVETPSLTLIVMLPKTPTSADVGVPESVPVAESKPAHAGWFCIAKERGSPSVSAAVGVKL